MYPPIHVDTNFMYFPHSGVPHTFMYSPHSCDTTFMYSSDSCIHSCITGIYIHIYDIYLLLCFVHL